MGGKIDDPAAVFQAWTDEWHCFGDSPIQEAGIGGIDMNVALLYCCPCFRSYEDLKTPERKGGLRCYC